MSDHIDQLLREAIAAGLLPADARRPVAAGRPWPVVLLIGLGAWLAALPLLGVVGLLLGDLLTEGAGPYLVGLLCLALATVVLRSRGLPLFVEQLAVPVLLVGLGSLALGCFQDLSLQTASVTLALVTLALAAVLSAPWLRVLLGAAAAGFCVVALVPANLWGGWRWAGAWPALHGAMAVWVVGLWVQRVSPGPGARLASALEPIGAGWVLGVLAGLAVFSGMTFLIGANLHQADRELLHGAGRTLPAWAHAGSSLLVLVATLWGARVWPGLRRPWLLGVGLVAAVLAWFLPFLGGAWLALVLTATSLRWRLAAASVLALAWIIGSFYYQLSWPLATKALVLVGVGALLGVLAWQGGSAASARRPGPGQGVGAGNLPKAPDRAWPRWAIALTLLGTLAVVNLGIWEKEALIAQGQPVFVALAPVDPRSLMQGDYMRLAFAMPGDVQRDLDAPNGGRRLVVAERDGRGLATLKRPAEPDEVLGQGELLMELVRKGGRWVLVTDAWYFEEGEAKVWEAARYGEFRVAPDGRALLVGLADAELRPIAPGR